MNTTVILVLVCIVLLPFFIPPVNIFSSLVVGMFFGAEAGGLAFIISTLFYLCIVFPLAHVCYAFKDWLARKEKARLADPAYALREAARRAAIDSKLAALVLKNPKRHRAMMARQLGLSP
jgi:hypothetical protein